MSIDFDDPPIIERPARDGSWGLALVTMLFVAYGVWSWYQIRDVRQLRIEIRDLRSEVNTHRVELSKLHVRLEEEEQQPSE